MAIAGHTNELIELEVLGDGVVEHEREDVLT